MPSAISALALAALLRASLRGIDGYAPIVCFACFPCSLYLRIHDIALDGWMVIRSPPIWASATS